MNNKFPGELEVTGHFSKHLGPRCQAAGLRISFHLNQSPGIYFKVRTSPVYAEAILKGINEGLDTYFPEFPDTASIWITEIIDDQINSSIAAFQRAGLLVIEQAHLLCNGNQN